MRLIDADLFMQRIESYNTLDEKDKALYNFALHEIVCMPTVDVLDKIRAEIEEERDKVYQNRQGCDTYYADGLDTALEIIDKYTKGDKA